MRHPYPGDKAHQAPDGALDTGSSGRRPEYGSVSAKKRRQPHVLNAQGVP